MLNQDDVNALFKKAVIKVHPDKNRRKDFRTKYLAKRVFELLNEAKKAQQSWLIQKIFIGIMHFIFRVFVRGYERCWT